MDELHDIYMERCFHLALLGRGNTSPNPLVGAVVVYNKRIIGEGYHMKYGQAHAEVNAINNIASDDKAFLNQSTLYVSLEPCCIHGKTPPCTDLIIKNKIPKVVFSCVDHTSGVQGRSIKILEKAGCEVITGVLAEKGKSLIKNRTIFTSQNRPYILLKYAQSSDGYIGKEQESIWMTNSISKRLVHKWRGEIDAIIVGTNTAQIDNPQLNNRLFYGKSPLRIVLDKDRRLPEDLALFDRSHKTWVITEQEGLENSENLDYIVMNFDEQLIPKLLKLLADYNCTSLMVEGGKMLLDSFIHLNLWDEARVFKTQASILDGITSPTLSSAPQNTLAIGNDELMLFYNK